jgi:hypothetical protein
MVLFIKNKTTGDLILEGYKNNKVYQERSKGKESYNKNYFSIIWNIIKNVIYWVYTKDIKNKYQINNQIDIIIIN